MRLVFFFFVNFFFNFVTFADPVNVRVDKIKIHNLYELYSSLGILTKSQSDDYSAIVAGKVTYVIDQNIQEVKKGQNIISINGDYANSLVNSTKQAKVKAETDYNNNLKLFDQQLISKQNLQLSKSAYYKSLSDYETSLRDYQNLVFIAPFDGKIGSIKQKVGDNVAVGDPLFSIIGESNEAVINFSLASFLIEQINKDSKVWIENNNKQIFGKIISVSPYLSKATGDFMVKVNFENKNDLIQNKYYNAYFQYNVHNGFAIKENSLMSSENGNFIYIVSDNLVKKLNVTTGTRLNGLVEVISDEIKIDDLVIIEGLNKVFPGSQVKIIE